jgi:hypothetical protein
MTEQQQSENGATGNENTGPQQQNNGAQTMSLDDATIERIAAASSRQAAQNHGQGPSQQNQQSAGNGAESNNHQGSNQSDVLTAIQALPEQITRSIKEALQPATNSANTQGNAGFNGQSQNNGAGSNDAGSNDSGQQQQPGKKRGFAEWWFGK